MPSVPAWNAGPSPSIRGSASRSVSSTRSARSRVWSGSRRGALRGASVRRASASSAGGPAGAIRGPACSGGGGGGGGRGGRDAGRARRRGGDRGRRVGVVNEAEQLRLLHPGWREVLELVLVAYAIYRVLRVFHGTRTLQVLSGLLILIVAY